jgi:hypothetical protein
LSTQTPKAIGCAAHGEGSETRSPYHPASQTFSLQAGFVSTPVLKGREC